MTTEDHLTMHGSMLDLMTISFFVKLANCAFKFECRSDKSIGCIKEIIAKDKHYIKIVRDPYDLSNFVKLQTLNARNIEELFIELEMRNLVTFI